MMSNSHIAVCIFALLLLQATALQHLSSKHNKVDADVIGNGLSATSLKRKAELMNMQMNTASAWMEADSLGDSSTDGWLGESVMDWISSRLQDASGPDGNTQLLETKLADTSDQQTSSFRIPEYHEFEKGATAQLGGDRSNDFWSLGMKEFLLSLNASAPHPSRHIEIRRQLGAQMLLEETDERNGWIEDKVGKYATMYLKELYARSGVMLSHISKSGGTDLCLCGFEAGCKATRKNQGQCSAAPVLNNQPAPVLANQQKLTSKKALCSTKELFYKTHNVTLVDNDDHSLDAGLCHQFWNVIVLRDPLDRIVSHLTYLYNTTESAEWRPELLNPKSLFETIPLLTNNFFIRTLIGSKGYDLPFGQVTEEHLEEAKQSLESFDLVLMKTSTLKQDLYAYMGWDCDHTPSKTGKPELYFKSLTETWTREQWQALKDANSLDMKLVQYARMLERVDKKVYRHPFFTFYIHELQYQSCPAHNDQCGYLCK